MRKRALLPLGLLVSLVIATTCESIEGIVPPFYSGKEIRATVVDAATGQSIEGAVVVVVWELRTISGEGPRLQVVEALTDAQGVFVTPAWGPKLRPPLAHAANNCPFLMIFKSAYVPVELHNASKRDFARLRAMTKLTAAQIDYRRPGIDGNPYDSTQESLWDGMAIRVEPFRGTPEDWFRHLENIRISAGWRDVGRMRRFYEALRAEREYFKARRVDPDKILPDLVESFFINIDNQLKRARAN